MSAINLNTTAFVLSYAMIYFVVNLVLYFHQRNRPISDSAIIHILLLLSLKGIALVCKITQMLLIYIILVMCLSTKGKQAYA